MTVKSKPRDCTKWKAHRRGPQRGSIASIADPWVKGNSEYWDLYFTGSMARQRFSGIMTEWNAYLHGRTRSKHELLLLLQLLLSLL